MPLLLVCEDNGLGHQRADPGGLGRRRRSPGGRGCATTRSTAPTRSAVYDATEELAEHVREPRRARPCCTCAPCASWATPAPTSRRPTAPASAIRADYARDPLLATARRARRRAAAPRRPSWSARYLRRSGRRPRPRPATWPSGPPLRSRRRGHGAAVAAASRRGGRRASAPPAAPTSGAFFGRAARGRGSADARRVDQPHARRPARRRARVLVFGEDVGVKGGVYGVTRGLQRRAGRRAGVRHAARRAVDPRPRARRRRHGAAADPRDPVPRLPPQRRGPAARRGGEPVVLLERAVPQPDGRAHRRLRLPEGVRRPLPQRQRGRRAARHPRAGHRLAGPSAPTRRRCCAPAWPRRSPTAR